MGRCDPTDYISFAKPRIREVIIHSVCLHSENIRTKRKVKGKLAKARTFFTHRRRIETIVDGLCAGCKLAWARHGVSQEKAAEALEKYRAQTGYHGPLSTYPCPESHGEVIVMGDWGHMNGHWSRGVGIPYVVECWGSGQEEDEKAETASCAADTDIRHRVEVTGTTSDGSMVEFRHRADIMEPAPDGSAPNPHPIAEILVSAFDASVVRSCHGVEITGTVPDAPIADLHQSVEIEEATSAVDILHYFDITQRLRKPRKPLTSRLQILSKVSKLREQFLRHLKPLKNLCKTSRHNVEIAGTASEASMAGSQHSIDVAGMASEAYEATDIFVANIPQSNEIAGTASGALNASGVSVVNPTHSAEIVGTTWRLQCFYGKPSAKD